RKHHFVHQNRPNSPVFCPARLYFFLINTTTIATMNKHSLENKRKCHVCAELRSGHAPLFNTDLRSLSNEFAHLPNRLQIMFFLVFCSVDGWLGGGVRSWRLNV